MSIKFSPFFQRGVPPKAGRGSSRTLSIIDLFKEGKNPSLPSPLKKRGGSSI